MNKKLAFLRKEADKSLYVKAIQILQYKDIRPRPHSEMCQFLESIPFGYNHPAKYRLLAVPRDCFKTTLGSVALPIDILTKYPNSAGLLTSENHRKSQAILSEIKQHYEKNEVFQEVYGNYVGDELWSRPSIIISKRTVPNKTPSIDTTGIGASMTSQHYDWIIADDLHSLLNYQTPEQRKKVVDHITDLRGLLKPHGFMLFVCTFWHPQDAYQWVKATFHPLQVMIRGWKYNGELYFPDRLTEDFVNSQKEVLTKAGNAKLFYAWYENNPIASELVYIRPEYRQVVKMVYVPTMWNYGYIHLNPGENNEEKKFVRITGVIDPADSKSLTADFTGITIKGIDKDGKWYVFEAKAIKGISSLTIPEICNLAIKYKCSDWGIETTGGRYSYLLSVQEAYYKQMILGRITELKSQNRSKASRIEALIPRFQALNVYVGNNCISLIEQLDYPEIEYDDVIDSLAYHNMMDITPLHHEPIIQEEEIYDPLLIHPKDRKKDNIIVGRDPVTGY